MNMMQHAVRTVTLLSTLAVLATGCKVQVAKDVAAKSDDTIILDAGTEALLAFSDSKTSDFGSIAVSSSSTDTTLTIANVGKSHATKISATISGDYTFVGGSFPGTGGTCKDTIESLSKCVLVVKFSPTLVGTLSGSIAMTYYDGVKEAKLSKDFTGIGTASGVASFTIAANTFSDTTVGNTHSAVTFTLTNSGSVAGTVTSKSLTTGTQFAITGGTCSNGAVVAASGTCTITATFTPTSSGAKADTITVVYNDGTTAGQTATRAISGNGLTPASFSIAANTFSDTTVGNTHAAVTFTLTNGGKSTGTVSSKALTTGTQFAITGGTCSNGATVAAGATCTITATFTPTSSGAKADTITVTYNNAVGAGQTATRAISGNGLTPASFTIAAGTFSDTTAGATYGPVTLTLTNGGGSTGTVSSKALTTGTQFVMNGGTCSDGATVAAGATCTITVTFSPTSSGAKADTVTVTYDNGVATGQTATRVVSGNGLTPASLAIVQTDAFPTHFIVAGPDSPSLTLTVSNSGQSAATSLVENGLGRNLSYTDGTYPGTNGTCATSLAAGASCTLEMTYAPKDIYVATSINVDVALSYNDGATAQDVSSNYTGYVHPSLHGAIQGVDIGGDGGALDALIAKSPYLFQRCTNAVGTLTCADETSKGKLGFNFSLLDIDKDGNVDIITGDPAAYDGNAYAAHAELLDSSFKAANATKDLFQITHPTLTNFFMPALWKGFDGATTLALFNSSEVTVHAAGNYDTANKPGFGYAAAGKYSMAFVKSFDINNDGINDLVYAASSNLDECNVYVGIGDASGGFTETASDFSGNFPNGTKDCLLTDATFADFDANGAMDIAVVSALSDRVVVGYGDGGGAFKNFTMITATKSGLYSVAATDTDKDGCPDLLFANYSQKTIERAVSKMQGGGTCNDDGWGAASVRVNTSNHPVSINVGKWKVHAEDFIVLENDGANGFKTQAFGYNQ